MTEKDIPVINIVENGATPSSDPTMETTPSTFKERVLSSVYRKKFAYTMCLLFGNFMSGWINGQRGPSLLDLQLITGSDMSQGSAFFTAAATGSVVGAVAGGAIYDRSNKYMSLFISMAGHGVTVAVIPLCTTYWVMIVMFVAHEFFLGIFKTGCNVELVRVWGLESKPYMQALHLFWSLGGIISPFVLEPFLAPKEAVLENRTTLIDNLTTLYNGTGFDSGNESSLVTNSSFNNNVGTPSPQSGIIWPFLMTGILTVLSSLPFLIVFILTAKDKVQKLTKTLTAKRQENFLPTKLLILTLACLGIFYFFLDEVEDSSVSFLAAYVVKQLNWSKSQGAWITSAFWGAYAFGRLAAIFFITWVSHVKILGIFFILLNIFQVGMILAGYFLSDAGIWITACGVGFSISIVFPAMLTWIEKDFLQLSGKIMSVIFVAVGFGGLVNPQIIGTLMHRYTPMWYNYVLTIESVLVFLSFLLLIWLVKRVLNKYYKKGTYQEEVQGNTEALTKS